MKHLNIVSSNGYSVVLCDSDKAFKYALNQGDLHEEDHDEVSDLTCVSHFMYMNSVVVNGRLDHVFKHILTKEVIRSCGDTYE